MKYSEKGFIIIILCWVTLHWTQYEFPLYFFSATSARKPFSCIVFFDSFDPKFKGLRIGIILIINRCQTGEIFINLDPERVKERERERQGEEGRWMRRSKELKHESSSLDATRWRILNNQKLKIIELWFWSGRISLVGEGQGKRETGIITRVGTEMR